MTNDSKDNSKDYSNIKSSFIRDNIPFLFSFGFILANSRRNHKRQEQNSSYFHFSWRNFSGFWSCWLFWLNFKWWQFLTPFDLTEKMLCNFIWRKNYFNSEFRDFFWKLKFQVMPIFNAFWFDGKKLCNFIRRKNYIHSSIQNSAIFFESAIW